MQTQNRLLDDLVRVASGAIGVATEMRGEVEARLLLPPPRVARPGRGRKAAVPDLDALDEGQRALFEALRAHRTELARAAEKPAYVIASDRCLRDLARRRPRLIEHAP